MSRITCLTAGRGCLCVWLRGCLCKRPWLTYESGWAFVFGRVLGWWEILLEDSKKNIFLQVYIFVDGLWYNLRDLPGPVSIQVCSSDLQCIIGSDWHTFNCLYFESQTAFYSTQPGKRLNLYLLDLWMNFSCCSPSRPVTTFPWRG